MLADPVLPTLLFVLAQIRERPVEGIPLDDRDPPNSSLSIPHVLQGVKMTKASDGTLA